MQWALVSLYFDGFLRRVNLVYFLFLVRLFPWLHSCMILGVPLFCKYLFGKCWCSIGVKFSTVSNSQSAFSLGWLHPPPPQVLAPSACWWVPSQCLETRLLSWSPSVTLYLHTSLAPQTQHPWSEFYTALPACTPHPHPQHTKHCSILFFPLS